MIPAKLLSDTFSPAKRNRYNTILFTADHKIKKRSKKVNVSFVLEITIQYLKTSKFIDCKSDNISKIKPF